ncbi:ankyrin repeat domain-containing protein [Wolbachia endosymbiont (group B) of Chesias legatella]|uniref:ankyrin repeat domain-containing protein n=1 Tax=Wolbachia endosymbiont (group B) of Chesias legatella TaxID=3066167 RepID=UPI0031330279
MSNNEITPEQQEKLNKELMRSAYGGDIAKVTKRISEGADVNYKDDHSKTPLHKAAEKGHLDIVKKLIESKADINSKDDQGETPLHKAAYYGHLAVVEKLIEKGADVNSKDNTGQTPLHEAEFKGHKEVADKLIGEKLLLSLTGRISETLMKDDGFKASIKGEPGPKGEKGMKGDAGSTGLEGRDADPEKVAEKLVTDPSHKNKLLTEIANNSDFQGAVVKSVKGDTAFQNSARGPAGSPGPEGPKGEKGDPGLKGEDARPEKVAEQLVTTKSKELGKAVLDVANNENYKFLDHNNTQASMSFKIVKGENYGDISSTKVSNEKNNDVGNFSSIGYFFQDNELYIRNYFTDRNIKIPQEFSFLRVVRDDDGELKLALCNSLGNLLSEYKKYDSEYRELPDFVENSHICLQKGRTLNLSYDWRPLFQLKNDSEGRSVSVYKVITNRKVGQLIDEFIYYDRNNNLHYKNYHNLETNKDCCYRENLYVNFGNKLFIYENDTENDNIPVQLEQSLDLF